MRHHRQSLITLASALILTAGAVTLDAQPIQKVVPPDPTQKRTPQDRLQREGTQFPEEKIGPVTEEDGLKLIRRDPSIEETEQYSARILKVSKNEITVQPKDKGDSVELILTADAVITLNRRPAKLSDLKAGDYVLVSERVGQSGMIGKLDVGRAPHVGTSPKATDSTANRTDSDERLPKGEQSALGVVISDSPGLGVLIVKVNRDTPAWISGLIAGDYLMRINGQSIKTPDDYLAVLQDQNSRGSVKLVVWREGKTFGGTSELMSATNAKDMIVDNGFALLVETRGEFQEPRPTTFEVETRKPVTVEDVDGSVTEIETDDDINVRTYGDLIEEHRKIQQRLEQLNEQLERIKQTDK